MNEPDSSSLLPAPDPTRRRGEVVFFGNPKHLEILVESLRRRSPRFWNAWRKLHPRIRPDLRGVVLSGQILRGLDLSRARLDQAVLRRVDLAGARLERACLSKVEAQFANLSWARAERADLTGAKFQYAVLRAADFHKATCLDEADFARADLRKCDFSGAKMMGTSLSEANLTGARFDGADLTGASLIRAILDGTSLLGATLPDALVNGAFIRRIQTDKKTEQSGLFVDAHVVWARKTPGRVIEFTMVDDIRVAQFHDIVDEHGSVGKLLAATTKRVVLILGRFLPRRKRVLMRLAEALRERGKIAVIFDFPGPDDREISDTVRFIAGMSQFIVVDLTKASSVPLELQATIPDLMVPVLPIIQSGHRAFAMFSDLQKRYTWIQPTVRYKDANQLVRYVDEAIVFRAERAAEQIQERRRTSIQAPAAVSRIGTRPRRKRQKKPAIRRRKTA